jgi:very-short-patch-repair endonuclease
MEINKLKNELLDTGYLNNIKIGSYFHAKYPTLYKELLKHTKELDQTYWSNKYLRSRFIFLIKYNLDSSKIKNNDKFFTFDRKRDDFVDRTGNYVSNGWKIIKNSIPEEVYDKERTIRILKYENLYTNFFGKAKNRVMIKQNPILYNSIYFHTKYLDNLNKNNSKFSSRIVFLVKYDGDPDKFKCDMCSDNVPSYNCSINDFNRICKDCFKTTDHYPHKGYFIKKYGDNWEYYYNEDRKKISNYKVNSLTWFIFKYGDSKGRLKHNEYLKKRLEVLDNLKTKKVSKISQKLFWLIYDELTEEEKEKCFFKELNREKLIKVNDSKYYFPDFILDKKIIEYDGSYWHNEDDDKVRNEFYNKNGFDVLCINENEFNRKTKNYDIITKCLNFLRYEI